MISGRIFSPEGRLRRWHFFLAFFVLNAFGGLLDRAVEQSDGSPFLYLFYLLIAWPFVTLMMQRAHDSGRSGKFVAMALGLMLGSTLMLALGAGMLGDEREWGFFSILAALILAATLLLGCVMTLIVYFSPGDAGTNVYGPNPRLRDATSGDAKGPHEPEDVLIDLAGRRGYDTGN